MFYIGDPLPIYPCNKCGMWPCSCLKKILDYGISLLNAEGGRVV